MHTPHSNRRWPAVFLPVLAVCITAAQLTACTSRDNDLDRFIADTRHKPGEPVGALPEIAPYQTFAYDAAAKRSPFVPGGSTGGSKSALRPDSRRNREFLERYAFDSMKMGGTLQRGNQVYGLVQTRDGLVHRVELGDHLGQNEGRVVSITPSKIDVREVVPDGLGGYVERPAALTLNP
jgi:type IV pilus assembly protein PilP